MTDHATLMRRAAIASLSVALFLIVLKFAAYLATDSVAMLASLADSGLDFFASIINLVAVRSSLTPPDREHRFPWQPGYDGLPLDEAMSIVVDLPISSTQQGTP